jgi:hypothetical protein
MAPASCANTMFLRVGVTQAATRWLGVIAMKKIASTALGLHFALSLSAPAPGQIPPRFTAALGAPGMRYAVATIADLDADNVEDLIVGVSSPVAGGPPGVVFIVSGATNPPATGRIIAMFSSPTGSSGFGVSVDSYMPNSHVPWAGENVIIGDDVAQRVHLGVVGYPSPGNFTFTHEFTPGCMPGISSSFGSAVRRGDPLLTSGTQEPIFIGDPGFQVMPTVPAGIVQVVVPALHSPSPGTLGTWVCGTGTAGLGQDRLGYALATMPDLDGDNVRELLAGGPEIKGPSLNNPGGAYVLLSGCGYSIPFVGGVRVPQIVLHGRLSWQQMGKSVTSIGDINGDGFHEVALGAPFDHPLHSQPSRGSVSIFDGVLIAAATAPCFPASNTPNYISALSAIGRVTIGTPIAHLGFAVDGPLDLDGDGSPEVLIAAPVAPGLSGDGRVVAYEPGTGTKVADIAEPSPTFGRVTIELAGGIAVIDPGTGALYAF